MGDMNFMHQSASYFLIQVSMLITTISQKVINWFAVKLAKNKYARRVGMYFSEEDAGKKLWSAYLKLLLESYFDICFCALLNTIAFRDAI